MPITESLKLATSLRQVRNPNTLTIIIGCLLSLVVLLSWVWLGVKEQFPLMDSGVYVGELVQSNGSAENLALIQKDDGSRLIGFQIDQWLQVPLKPQNRSEPLEVSFEKGVLSFSGRQSSDGFEGKLILNDRPWGTWRLAKVSTFEAHGVGSSKPELYWLDLASEKIVLENKVKKLSAELDETTSERTRVEKLLTDTRALKKDGDEKLRSTKAEQDALQSALTKRRAILKSLENKMFLSQRVTSRGKLVSLAREGLQRERRWAESLERSGGLDRSQDMMEAYDRGLRVLDLRKMIDTERSRIYRLQSMYDRRLGNSNYRDSVYENRRAY